MLGCRPMKLRRGNASMVGHRRGNPVRTRMLLLLPVLGLVASCAGTDDMVLDATGTVAESAAARLCLPEGGTPSDRIVNLHTRTMMSGLACGPVWGDPQAFSRYAQFTVRHAELLRSAQSEVARRLGGNQAFDRMHTRMSNAESMRMRQMGPSVYCARMREPFYAAMEVSPLELEAKAVTANVSAIATPACGAGDGA